MVRVDSLPNILPLRVVSSLLIKHWLSKGYIKDFLLFAILCGNHLQDASFYRMK